MKLKENISGIVVTIICIVIAIVVGYFFYKGFHENRQWERLHQNGDKVKVKPNGGHSYVTYNTASFDAVRCSNTAVC